MKKYIHGQEDIEDVVQDVFVHLWKNRNSLSHNMDAVVFKTSKQEIANFYRRNKLSFSDLKENFCAEEENDIEEEFLQYSEKIEKILCLISEKSRTFFLKNKIDGLSYSQIAQENHISKNAVAKHVSKVLHLLKTHINLFSFF